MIVAAILRQKGSNLVETIVPTACIADAAAVLSSRRIGALICSVDGKTIAGMISERDIIRVLGKEGPACLSRPVSEIMTADVKTCSVDDTTESLLQRDDLEHETSALAGMIKGY
jgi:CBS domain-containing protein